MKSRHVEVPSSLDVLMTTLLNRFRHQHMPIRLSDLSEHSKIMYIVVWVASHLQSSQAW